MDILGIETSCDETAAAIVRDGQRVLSSVISSQIHLHRAYGGVVPELAARGHVAAVVPVIETALTEAGLRRDDLDAIAVTAGPGLAGALLVGVNVAKGLAYALRRPLIGVNHLEAHVLANWLDPTSLAGAVAATEPFAPPELPALCLLVSGGHTELILVEAPGRYQHLGRTLDDAAGEAFDKGARLLGLGYPGGPAMQRAAAGGDRTRFDLPRAWLGDSFDFSFSGLKTALIRLTEPYRLPPEPAPIASATTPFPEHRPARFRAELPVADLAASYQEAVIDVLAVKTARAAAETEARSVLLAGGVAANTALREKVRDEVARRLGSDATVPVRFPPLALCTDNAAMVAGAARHRPRSSTDAAVWELDIHPRWPLEQSQIG